MMNNFGQVRQEFLKCNILRNEMSHFVNNLYNYMMVEVIEGTWNNFFGNLDQAIDFNDIIMKHEKFV